MTRQTVNFARAVSVFFLGVLQSSCVQREPASDDLYRAVDELYDAVVAATDRFDVIAEIDHSGLAALQGETMPPARVVIFSDSIVNTSILQQEP